MEGVIDQMIERLGNLEQGQHCLYAEMRVNFRWTVGIMLAMWITIIGSVLGALIAKL